MVGVLKSIPLPQLRYYSYLLTSSIALEVAGYPKPGNVHRLRDFSDTLFEDFLVTSVVVGYHVFRAVMRGCKLAKGYSTKVLVGDLIKSTVNESKKVTGGGNTCLGSTLLLYPLSIATGYILCMGYDTLEPTNIGKNTKELMYRYSTSLDSVYFYDSVRAASPSYIRRSDVVGDLPNVWDDDYREKLLIKNYRFWDILTYSSKNDIVCKEVVEGYVRSLRNLLFLKNRLKTHGNWNLALVETYLYQLTHDIDTLIVRKYGFKTAQEVSTRASEVLNTCLEGREGCWYSVKNFDEELTRRNINPGSSADIIVSTIALYVVEKRESILRV
jgi:triphosphoribosyl-dephospho-CoA synthase